jgi:hypothetical protein
MASSPELLDPIATRPASVLIGALAAATEACPLERKLVVAASPAQGRELLGSLARCGTAWIGWEPTSLRQLALDLASPGLVAAGVHRADEFDLMRLVDGAMDAVHGRGGAFTQVIASPGLRGAAHRAVATLRGGGITPDALRAAGSTPAHQALAEVLSEYERLLAAERREDGAGLLRRAVEALEGGAAALPECRIYLVPGLDRCGLAGRLVSALLQTGRVDVLETDPVVGVESPVTTLWREAAEPVGRLSFLHAPDQAPAGSQAPELRFFAAATPVDELREVLRQVLGRGLSWDEVEIVATDAFTYGPALDGLARRLRIPVTHAAGLSSQRTRVGRAVAAYLQWVTDGFPADVLRKLLEAGDLAAPDGFDASGAGLAYRLRGLHVGWGKERYLPAVERALKRCEEPAAPDDERDPEEIEAQRSRRREQLRALQAMLRAILAAVPDAPDRLRVERARTSPAALAAGMLAFLEFVPTVGEMVENTTRGQIVHRLERVRETLTRQTGWDGAVATLRAHLELMVAAQEGGTAASWTSAGGHLHLSDLRTGGFCGRRVTFVVGLDATRTGAARSVDPLLSDRLRRELNERIPGAAPALPTTPERVAMGRHAVAALLARLGGEVVLSYSAWDAAEGRAVSPSAELLQAYRLWKGDPHLGYGQLHAHLASLACAVPHDEVCLDASDVWMHALAGGRTLRDGQDAVLSAFRDLERGLAASASRQGDRVTEYHGRLDPDAARDAIERMIFSPSRLEALGACPRRFFYQYLLRLRPTSDTEWDPERWLDPLTRGLLLHNVYERTLRAAREECVDLAGDAAEELALEILAGEVEATRHDVPPPSERVFEEECEQLREDVRVFMTVMRAAPPAWTELEYEFGQRGREVELEIAGVRVRLRGKIDRVDRTPSGGLRVIDYKTGSRRGYRVQQPFNGGRRIQHVIYLLAAEQLFDEQLEGMEYHFPTIRGEKETVVFSRDDVLPRGREVLRTLLATALDGHFVATDHADDCRYCNYASVCRVRENDYGGVQCGVAQWGKDTGIQLDEYRHLRTLREIDVR